MVAFTDIITVVYNNQDTYNMENIGINLLHFEIIKIKIDTKIYLNYYYHSQSKSKQVNASQSKSKQVKASYRTAYQTSKVFPSFIQKLFQKNVRCRCCRSDYRNGLQGVYEEYF
jgi:hypothetical protein